MISFRNKPYYHAALLSAALILAPLGGLHAQSQPRLLVPKAQPLAPPADAPRMENPQAVDSPAARTIVEGVRIKGQMVVQDLKAIDSSSTGLLGEGERGLGLKMWAGTPRRRLAPLIGRLPAGSTSPALQDLFRRLILTTALVSPPARGRNSDDLIHLRLTKLYGAGLLEDVPALAGRLRTEALSPDSRKLLQDSYWLLGDRDRACRNAAEHAEQSEARADPFWTRAVLFCQALEGRHERAEMGAVLLEEGGDQDAAFFELLAKMADPQIEFSFENQTPSPLHLAMAGATKTEIPLSLLGAAGPGFLRAAALNKSYSAAYRLAAAWRAAAYGVMPAQELDALLGDQALGQTFEGPFLLADYQLAKSSTNAETVRQALQNLIQQMSQNNGFFPLSSLLGDQLSQLQPDRNNTMFLLNPARTFLALEKLETAGEWLRQARRASLAGNITSISQAQAAIGRLEPVMLIAGAPGAGNWDDKTFLRWRRAVADRPVAERRAAGNMLLSLLDAVGVSVPIRHWQLLIDQDGAPDMKPTGTGGTVLKTMSPAAIRSMLDAAQNNRIGETVSIVLSELGTGDLGAIEPSGLLVAIGVLRQIGLEREARALAVEAALAGNL